MNKNLFQFILVLAKELRNKSYVQVEIKTQNFKNIYEIEVDDVEITDNEFIVHNNFDDITMFYNSIYDIRINSDVDNDEYYILFGSGNVITFSIYK